MTALLLQVLRVWLVTTICSATVLGAVMAAQRVVAGARRRLHGRSPASGSLHRPSVPG